MKRIVDLMVEKVAAVDAPANRRRFLMVKRADGDADRTGKEDDMSKDTKLRDRIAKLDLGPYSLTDEAAERLRKEVNEAVEAEAKEEADAAREEAKREAEAAAATRNGNGNGNGGGNGDGDGDGDGQGEEIDKSALPEPVRKRLEAMEKAEKDAKERIEKLERERQDQVFLAKARELPSLPLDEAERRDVLRELAIGAPEAYGRLEKALTAMQEQINRGDLFSALGADGRGDDDVEAPIRKRAEEIRKGAPTLTIQQALTQAYRENPDAYAASLSEGGNR